MLRSDLVDKMPYEEFLYWQAFYHVTPFGEEIDDLRTGIICSTIHNNAMGQKEPKGPKDYMPYGRYKKEHSLETKMKAFVKTLGNPVNG